LSLVIDSSLLLSIIGLGVSATAFLINLTKTSKTDSIELEKRLTTLESDKFTDTDRKCLYDILSRFNVLWGVFEKDLPRFLKQETTPALDALIEKLLQVGIRGLDKEEYLMLDKYMAEEYEKALADESLQGRGFRLALFRAVSKFNRSKSTVNSCINP
jgi:hypothetical protein